MIAFCRYMVISPCAFLKICSIVTQAHRTAKFCKSLLFREKGDDMGTFPEFLARGIGNVEFMAGKFNNRQLETETEPEEGDVIFAGKPDRFYLSFDTPFAKPSGY